MRFRALATLAVACAGPSMLLGQTPSPAPTLDFSGVLFGNYQYRTDAAARASTGGKPMSRFDLDRAYLNFRMPAGDRASIRVTTDVYKQSGAAAAYYAGWAIRLKYGWLQYDATKNLAGVQGLGLLGRVGMLQTVVIDHIETFWPRWMGNSAVEQHGFFSSADAGVAGLLTLPSRRGEIYATAVNGSGYGSQETDRFKDFAARASITPFANDSGFLRTLAITPWFSKGWSASQFVTGGAGQVGPVSDGLRKDRWGLFAGLRDRRLTAGAEFSQRLEDVEAGSNTVGNPRTVAGRHRDLISAFAFVRPLELIDSSKRSRWGVLGRFDKFDLDDTNTAVNEINWFGAFWDLNQRATFTIDYQEFKAKGGSTATPTKTWFMHWVAYY